MAWEAKSDVVISPKVREFAWDDFVKTPQLVAAGEEAAIEALPRIQEALRRASERLAAPRMPQRRRGLENLRRKIPGSAAGFSAGAGSDSRLRRTASAWPRRPCPVW